MKKSIYLTTITIITVVCIIIGSCYHIFGVGQGAFSNIFNLHNSTTSGSVDTDSHPSKSSQTFDSFSHITVDTNVMDVTIEKGDEYKVSYNSSRNELTPTVKLEGGGLKITQKRSSNFFSGNIFHIGNNGCSLIITVPSDVILDYITVDSNVGDVTMKNVSAKRTTLDLSVGDVDAERCELGETNISSSTGDVELSHTAFGNISVDTSVGDVDIESAVDLRDYSFDLDTSVGEIDINDHECGDSYTSDGSSDKTISVDGSTGDISVTY